MFRNNEINGMPQGRERERGYTQSIRKKKNKKLGVQGLAELVTRVMQFFP